MAHIIIHGSRAYMMCTGTQGKGKEDECVVFLLVFCISELDKKLVRAETWEMGKRIYNFFYSGEAQ